MRARILVDNPQATLEATKLILKYVGEGEERVAIPGRALRRATRLVQLIAKVDKEKKCTWVRSKCWRQRLEMAGLDPETCEVVDQGLWDMAWEQLSRKRTFRDDVQRRWIREGYVAERAGSYVRAVQLPERRREDADRGALEYEMKKKLFDRVRK